MNINDSHDAEESASANGVRANWHYRQLGAPTLIYEGKESDWLNPLVDSNKLPTGNARYVCDTLKRRVRARARWEYPLDVGSIGAEVLPNYIEEKASNSSVNTFKGEDEGNRYRHKKMVWMDTVKQQYRLVMLLDNDAHTASHRRCLKQYGKYEHPYIKTNTNHNGCGPKVGHSKGQEFSIQQKINSDPSYLVPFDFDSIQEAIKHHGNKRIPKTRPSGFRRNVSLEPRRRLPQGNALLSVPCPCDSCSKDTRNFILLHAKGDYLERLCASNLVLPLGIDNASNIRLENKEDIHTGNTTDWNVAASQSNEICLDDTILEIKQCGTWNFENQECIFTVRTGTHISVVSMVWKSPSIREGTVPKSICSGYYIMKEIERMDLRSFSSKLPSFLPISLATHPRYGNPMTPCRFAFVSHSAGGSSSPSYNVVHSCTFASEKAVTTRHDINNLRTISFIDFSSNHPMCLWAAASSYVRPALAPGAISKMKQQQKGPFGLGSSLFSIDLRSNFSTFQWSPSAEEMTTEGVHSINGISTDWTRENVVFVTSVSARKTWEIDGRMPCRAVNTWSLTGICEEYKDITVPSKSFYGEPSLLTRPLASSNGTFDAPIVKVDTDFSASGIHVFQRPLRKPRFQTESLECIGTAGLDITGTASIARSSYLELTDVSQDNFICGLSAIRVPLSQYVGHDENIWSQYLKQNLNVLCTLTINNTGDIFSHSLLECNDTTTTTDSGHGSTRFDGLPVGTRAIGLPNEIDGRTKYLANGQSKPNVGGMNLNLFLSNVYPVPRNAILSCRSDNAKTTILLNNSRKKRIDESSEVIRIPKRVRKPGLVIGVDGDSNGMINRGGENRGLVMSLSLSRGAQQGTKVYNRETDANAETEKNSDEGNQRSDLSREIIQNTLGGWDDTASEPESSDDVDSV